MTEIIGIEIFNLLHDGVLVGIKGSVPGDLTLVVECQYLRERISDPGDVFLVRISQCNGIRYESNEPGKKVIQDLASIAQQESDILSVELINDEAVIYTGPGQLILKCKSVSVATNEQTPLSVDKLEEVAKAYWSEWHNGSLAGRLMFICERLFAGKDTVSESVKEVENRYLIKLEGDVDELIVQTRDELLKLATEPNPEKSMGTLKALFEKLKTKFPKNAP